MVWVEPNSQDMWLEMVWTEPNSQDVGDDWFGLGHGPTSVPMGYCCSKAGSGELSNGDVSESEVQLQ